MKTIKSASAAVLAVFLALVACPAFATNPTRIGSTPGPANEHVGRTPSCACATDDFIVFLFGIGGSPASPVVADTQGTVTTDFAFNGSIGVYHVANAADVSHAVSVTWGTAPTNYYMSIVEANGSPFSIPRPERLRSIVAAASTRLQEVLPQPRATCCSPAPRRASSRVAAIPAGRIASPRIPDS